MQPPGALNSRRGGSPEVEASSFSDRLSETAFSQAIQVTSWAIPAIQTVHIIALATLFACALVLALRFMGRGLAAEPLERVSARFTPLIWKLLLVLLLSGSLLIIAEPGRTLTNPVFFLKMSMLVVACVLTLWLANAARRGIGRLSALHATIACCTMLLWAGIIVAGRFIAYVESY
jgi:hypothetical protein